MFFKARSALVSGLMAVHMLLLAPSYAMAQGMNESISPANVKVIVSFLIFLVVSMVFSRLWIGIVNASFIHAEPIGSIEKRQPYIPSPKIISGTIVGTLLLFLLAVHGLRNILPLHSMGGAMGLAIVFAIVGGAALAVEQRWRAAREYVFAGMMGTGISIVLIGFQHALFTEGTFGSNPYFMALSVLCIALTWRCLFGPWNSHIKATVLGMFLFWIGVYMISKDASDIRLARILAGMVAFVPAIIWCGFFLKYHYQRTSLVLLMFFAGMLSTAPILFYDKLVRSGSELQFFLFRIVPENFNQTSSVFVAGNVINAGGVRSTLLVSFLSFMFVGVVEEVSKFWVLKKSGTTFFTSIDDAMQLSIIVAIGFAFAENIINPTYFMSFVQDFLMHSSPDWGGFLGNVMGRAILTNMVHIVATGVLGYFFGMALFAGPYIREAHGRGKMLWVADGLHALLGFPQKIIFRRQMFLMGLTLAIALHGLFNFLVTFPEILPSHPSTLGDLFGSSPGAAWNFVPILMIPSLFYVVGGFWLLTDLFYKKENMKEHGHLVTTDTFVTAQVVA
ncbi:hypothetical protein COU78_04730 [Candidatus Peregrinibacteria bacterium CG10_big_fil_rev_8_21_14_0_10_49_24]|nr:MAG: hypothetical protein COV83_03875 [Candidatus Peregrinibacteria bacterium CG11_big_fil_rev_8_21_14_0_20_49_14]PIR50656.1 MAG: hypothetical protein COU78_04730 [Candidatus Peregrinibacteria bacterium CG10_big_fil_rev_8_21_14_0_10_49_24]PJA67740.1 MAG: hypothetical protein CO157_03020 [Candidatus Peregrinibacteria bacterium CG_4_9_14_3_um_filter_49_12]